MNIRRGIPSDARDVKSAHYHAYQKSYRGYLPDEFLDNMPFDEAIIERTANAIKEKEYYVAEVDNRVVGFASLDYPDEKTVEIMAIYVHPDFQKQGVGSALLNEVCRLKSSDGYRRLVLWTIKDGPSLGFYAKQGLKKSEGVEGKFWKCNVKIIQLEKEL